jgi:hypothetical protein
VTLKLLLKRGALLAVANWQAVAIQFLAETTFQVLLAVPIFGAAVLVAVSVGADLGDLLQGNLREMATNIARALTSEPMALGSFLTAFAIALAGGSALTCLVKGGTLDVLLAAHEAAGPIEREAVTFDSLRGAAQFSLPRFMSGCVRLFRSYLGLGLVLVVAYAVSGAAYLACVVYGYRAAEGVVSVIGWTAIAAFATVGLILWITLVNLVYLLIQIAMAADNIGLAEAFRAVGRFVRSEASALSRMFLIILALVVGATLVSALAWSGVGLIAFVPLVGLAVVPLQLVALILRGLAFEYIGLAAAGAYLTLYRRMPHDAERSDARLGLIETPVGAMAPAATAPAGPGVTPSGSSGSGPAAA